MLTTQQAILAVMRQTIAQTSDEAGADTFRKISTGLDTVHLGIDIAWDVLISIAVILFGLAMLRHPRFGLLIGALGVALGSLLLGFNIWYFPVPRRPARSTGGTSWPCGCWQPTSCFCAPCRGHANRWPA